MALKVPARTIEVVATELEKLLAKPLTAKIEGKIADATSEMERLLAKPFRPTSKTLPKPQPPKPSVPKPKLTVEPEPKPEPKTKTKTKTLPKLASKKKKREKSKNPRPGLLTFKAAMAIVERILTPQPLSVAERRAITENQTFAQFANEVGEDYASVVFGTRATKDALEKGDAVDAIEAGMRNALLSQKNRRRRQHLSPADQGTYPNGSPKRDIMRRVPGKTTKAPSPIKPEPPPAPEPTAPKSPLASPTKPTDATLEDVYGEKRIAKAKKLARTKTHGRP